MNTKPTKPTPPADPAGGGDPSMEDILASIRRILSEDEAQPAAVPPQPAEAAPARAPARAPEPVRAPEAARGNPDPGHAPPGHAPEAAAAPDVLVLDSSMMVQEPPVTPPEPAPVPAIPPRPASGPTNAVPDMPAPPQPAPPQPVPPQPAPHAGPAQLVAPEAAAAASAAVGTLMRTLAAERGATVHRGGPTIEDLVRDEIRPLLKQWLDAHLPPLVERLVRAEIERVVGGTAF